MNDDSPSQLHYALGRSFASLAADKGARHLAVGRDGRLSSPDQERALVEGLEASGAEVTRIGLGPTPMLYFAVHHLQADGGIMVTGSHNPPDHNGFKMMLGLKPFFGDSIRQLGEIASAGDWRAEQGRSRSLDIAADYVGRVAEGYRSGRPLKAVWDCGNGAAAAVIAQLLKDLPGQHLALNDKVDGTFPAHHPDPTVAENLQQLQHAVTSGGYDVGFAFDGDADRIGIVDEAGRILWGDQILALLARDVLARNPGAPIIADVKSSQVLFDEIERAGGKAVMYRTGHSHIKAKMQELDAPLAGEMSGHIFFADGYYGFDDALYAAVRFLDMAARCEQPVSALLDSLPQMVNTPEIRFDCADERKFELVEEVRQRLQGSDCQVNDIDGVRVTTADGWWLLRASNTQPVLVARCEAVDQAGLEKLKQALRHELAAVGADIPDDF